MTPLTNTYVIKTGRNLSQLLCAHWALRDAGSRVARAGLSMPVRAARWCALGFYGRGLQGGARWAFASAGKRMVQAGFLPDHIPRQSIRQKIGQNTCRNKRNARTKCQNTRRNRSKHMQVRTNVRRHVEHVSVHIGTEGRPYVTAQNTFQNMFHPYVKCLCQNTNQN